MEDSISSEAYKVIEEYENGFQRAMSNNINPFGEITGILLVHCLEEQIDKMCIPGTQHLYPFYHQVISDIMTMRITEAIKY